MLAATYVSVQGVFVSSTIFFDSPEQVHERLVAGKEPETCGDCKHVGTYRDKRIAEETGFDDQIQFHAPGDEGLAPDDDGNETLYICKRPKDGTSADRFADNHRKVPVRRRVEHAAGLNVVLGECTGWLTNTVVDPVERARRVERKAELDRLMQLSAARAAKEVDL